MSNDDKTRMIGIVCERSVDLNGHLNEQDYMIDNPDVKIIKVPCSGHIQPIMIETAIKLGADGVFATGCRMGDCHYREGNRFLRERLLGERMPKLKPNVNKQRVRAYWLSALEYSRFNSEVCDFKEYVKCLGPAEPVAAAAGKPAAK